MSAAIIDGRAVAAAIESELQARVARLGSAPLLAVVQVGNDPASTSYIRAKSRAAERVGVELTHHHLSANILLGELEALVEQLNSSEHGIIIQLPLPDGLEPGRARRGPAPARGRVHPPTHRKQRGGAPRVGPCTPAGIIELLERSGHSPAGKNAVIVGRSNIVGKPLAVMLTQANATVTVCHTGTADLAHHTRLAELLVVAAGRPDTVTPEMVRPGATVIDVG
ncbi:MAG: bifunctional 5,10-methylenetetrahydrofolate dehydrogenase/5,10-methenyltetrahydrofolate cyclohydrolase, partial [Candidatus Poseidoniia archaeon]|nr:bifunctional 5,10-methylenetetrahydrofolate dehydrogenase/5,10-methenyltetrahydrofolate cyclohydrolase [Candidatus Poseidoniia archaeon]